MFQGAAAARMELLLQAAAAAVQPHADAQGNAPPQSKVDAGALPIASISEQMQQVMCDV